MTRFTEEKPTMAASPGPRTLADQFDLYNGRTTGFDYLRITLAIGVLAWHSFGVTYGREALDAFFRDVALAPAVRMILPMFFALSGFLVTASLYRSDSLKVYLIFRGLRLFPALTVEVALAAVILGPIVTSLTLGEYFTAGGFYSYFLNILGLVHYELPGVFHGIPYPRVVNGSLWTVPYELECYFYLALFFVLGVFRNRWFVLLVFIGLTIMSVALGASSAKGVVIVLKNMLIATPEGLEPNLQQAVDDRIQLARILVVSFFAGASLYAWRDKVPLNAPLAAICAVISFLCLGSSSLYFYAPMFATYLTVWLGLQNPTLWGVLKTGDYSYGIYLYAFPIQQALMLTGWFDQQYLFHLVVTLAVVSLFAAFSWHVIEKPSLKAKSYFLPSKVS
ncbi:acyltransferase family protein [Ruegeria sp.]|uniref:acyltransferase family protein n=1 Tax=Ruegeria sp. TaxID=1879320 RepID=UPI003B5A2FFF